MRVKNYEEWYQAVNAEHRKLSEMSHYLNEKGSLWNPGQPSRLLCHSAGVGGLDR